MWVFGHLGFGSRIARPFARGLPLLWLLLGTLLPDLIDKPLYYAFALATGRRSFDLGWISCTRTIGHTALLTLSVALLAFLRKSKPIAAVAIGMATHLVLDGVQDYWFHAVERQAGESSAFAALVFPFGPGRFSGMPFASIDEHLRSVAHPFLWVTEAIGFVLALSAIAVERRRLRSSVRNGSLWRRSKAGR